MPVAPGKAQTKSFAEVELGENIMRPEAPIIRCRVVYMGNNRNRSCALPGQIRVERVQTGFDEKGEPSFETLKSAINEGIQNYDFASHDSLGKIIAERLMPSDAGPELAGKPFAYCEHIDHVRWFYQQRTADGAKEFRVLASREEQPLIQDYVRRFMRSSEQKERDFNDVTSR